MRPLEANELTDLDAYAQLRPDYRRAVIAHKRDRRMAVGDRVTLVFEDRETLRFQVQEMLFIERIGESERVQYELDVYNELMPGERELSAILFIEITDLVEIRPALDRLIGLDEHVSLVVGTGADAHSIAADFDQKQLEEDRIAAVQYIRFRLSEAQAARFADVGVPVSVRVDHPAYRVESPIPDAVRASLASGLFAEPAPLLEPGAVPRSADRVLFETARVRALARAGTSLRAHIVVEPSTPGAPLDDALWQELLLGVRRAVESVTREFGRARVHAEIEGDAPAPRWHVVSVEERSG